VPRVELDLCRQLRSPFLTDLYEEAVEALKRGIIRNREFLGTDLALAPLYAGVGRIKEAEREIKEILRVRLHFSIEMLRRMMPSKHGAIIERLIEAFREAELK